MNPTEITKYYMQEQLIERIMEMAQYREVVPTYPTGYGKRPDALNFPGDFLNMVEKGAVAFHGSVEIWRNPLLIEKVKNVNAIRTGWDLVMDIDCDRSLEIAKATVSSIGEALIKHGIKHFDVKFSGSRGFHIAVHRSAFPKTVQNRKIENWYPELPQAIVNYLRDYVHENLKDVLKGELKQSELSKDALYRIVNIENNWGSRHLFRLPYSLNEKKWLVSIPLALDQVDDFRVTDARPQNTEFEIPFLKSAGGAEEASDLVIQALDWKAKQQEEIALSDLDYKIPEQAIPRECFPPCIDLILGGLNDGRKRALFILLNFFSRAGYDYNAIKNIITHWNLRNEEPLNDHYVKGQLRYMKRQKEQFAPPNCNNKGYYADIGICRPDKLCGTIKNPIGYALKKHFLSRRKKKQVRPKYICPRCGKPYKTEKWFKEHMRECF